MTLVLPSNPRNPSFLESLGIGASQALPGAVDKYFSTKQQQQQDSQRNEQFKRLTGLDGEGFSPEFQQAIAIEQLKGKNKLAEYDAERAGKLQASQEEAAQRQKQVRGIEKYLGLEEGSLGDFEQNPALANQVARPKAAMGGLGGQAVPQEVSQGISSVLQANPTATADELANAFDQAQIPRGYSGSYIENRRRQDESKSGREMDFHKESQKYDEDLIKQTYIAKKQKETVKDLRKNVKNIKTGSIANMFKGLGPLGDKVSEAFLSKDQAALQASIPQLLEGWKEIFGVRLSDADLRLLQDKLPSIGKTQEANEAIFKILEKYADTTTLRGEIARDIKKANKGLRPIAYADKIEERFDEMVAPVRIVNPNTGNIIEIPAYKVSDAVKAGAKLANE